MIYLPLVASRLSNAPSSIVRKEGNEITGDTYAPELTVEGFVTADEPARWRILGESAWEKSERGYLLDASGGKNPMYYSFQTLARL